MSEQNQNKICCFMEKIESKGALFVGLSLLAASLIVGICLKPWASHGRYQMLTSGMNALILDTQTGQLEQKQIAMSGSGGTRPPTRQMPPQMPPQMMPQRGSTDGASPFPPGDPRGNLPPRSFTPPPPTSESPKPSPSEESGKPMKKDSAGKESNKK